MRILKEGARGQYTIDISSIQNNGDAMLSFQEMINEVFEHAGIDDIVDSDEDFFEKTYQMYLKSHPRKNVMGSNRYEDDDAWMLAMKATLNKDISMLEDIMISDWYGSGCYDDLDNEYKAIWDECVHEAGLQESSFHNRWISQLQG